MRGGRAPSRVRIADLPHQDRLVRLERAPPEVDQAEAFDRVSAELYANGIDLTASAELFVEAAERLLQDFLGRPQLGRGWIAYSNPADGRDLMTYFLGKQIELGFVHPNPAFLDNRCYFFLAPDALSAGAQTQDEKEDIHVLLEPLAEIPRLIREGAITHSLVVAAFYRLSMEHFPLVSVSDHANK